MSPPDLHSPLGHVRQLTEEYKAGGHPKSFNAFKDLVQLLLSHTILSSDSAVRLTYGPKGDEPIRAVLGGWAGPDDPLLLNDGRHLRLTMVLYLENSAQGPRVKVRDSSFQYQTDTEGTHWIFRYDYLRESLDVHPSMHLHVRGILTDQCPPSDTTLERFHFPTNRISIEAVIRLLIEQFHIQANQPVEIWRPLLTESETAFLQISHRSTFGPAS